jgi:hypothetical protein
LLLSNKIVITIEVFLKGASMAKARKVKQVEVTPEVKKELRWDLMALIASGSKEDEAEIQVALEKGYEPFSVVPHMINPEPATILQPGQSNQPKMVNLIWFKRGHYVEIKEEV